VSACPRCGQDLDLGQEYCLDCGLRVPGQEPLEAVETAGRGWLRRTLLGLVIAAAGTAAAVSAVGGTSGGSTDVVTAIGGFATPPATDTVTLPGSEGSSAIGDWPTGRSGWTIVLATLPQELGEKRALARARAASRSGLTDVGVLDSSRFASLHPGYWLVFSGVYGAEAEATSALRPARAFVRTAGVRRIVP
jgi:hypothetical protein